MTTVTLNGKRVLCDTVVVSGKKGMDTKPYANFPASTEAVEVQTLPYENLKLVLQGVRFPTTTADLADASTFRYEDLLDYYSTKYDGSSGKYTLIVQYGKDVDHILAGLGTTSGIPVVIESFNLPISASDSKKGYMPTGTVTLSETK